MTRWMILAVGLAACTVAARADDPPKTLTAVERKALESEWAEANASGVKAFRAGKIDDAAAAFEGAVKLARRLYAPADFPSGHADIATSLSNLASMYRRQGKWAAAKRPNQDALEMRRRLFKGDHADVATSLNNLGLLSVDLGELAAAERLLNDAAEMQRRLFKGDHPNVGGTLTNLGLLHLKRGEYAAAELLFKDALEMQRRLHKGDHPDVAVGLSNLATVYRDQGRWAVAKGPNQDALEMLRRLFRGDHPDVAVCLRNLATVHLELGELAAAEPLFKDATDMARQLFGDDHPDVARCLDALGNFYRHQRKYEAAEPRFKDALSVHRRLHKGDNQDLATGIHNLGSLYLDQGRWAAAEPLLKDALGMRRRLFKGDHYHVAAALSDLGFLYRYQGRWGDAETHLRETLEVTRRLATAYARQKSEGEALNFVTSHSTGRDGYLSLARARAAAGGGYDPASAYPAVWAVKGAVARVYEQRHLRARAASADPALVGSLARLTDARRRRADFLLARPAGDPETRTVGDTEFDALDVAIATLDRDLSDRLPDVARFAELDAATPADLRNALPADAALVDYFRYTFYEWDDTRPAGQKYQQTARYLAFVVTRDAVAWVDLESDAAVKSAVDAWRAAIDSGKAIPADVPAKARDAVWGPVRKHLPAGVRVVYVCPDADLCQLPFAAVPGDKPNTILLDEFAVAVVPHAPFLLDRLRPGGRANDRTAVAVVVGGVDYDGAGAGGANGTDPLIRAGQKLGWGFLPNSVGEADGVAAAAGKRKLAVTRLDGEGATAAAVLAALPKAKVAHLATHGFFADPSFRGLFQLDEKDFERTRLGERVGRAANSPLVMTGLVLTGANRPQTPGRGIVTGEALVDLDLSGLDLAVLSACETGLGDLGGGGEGVFGLQRAFHYAGARNVVCSLWKVPDRSTAALMGLFYRNLWEKDLPPVEALRRAQLHLYRNPKDIAGLADGFRAGFKTRPGATEEGPADAGETAHPVKWAAFTISGPGR